MFLIDLQTLKITCSISLPQKLFSIFQLDKNVVILGGEQNLFQVFVDPSTPTLKLLNSFLGHQAQINDIGVFPNDSILVSASKDASLVFWKFDLMYESFRVIGKIFPSCSEGGKGATRIWCDSETNEVLMVDSSDMISRFFLDLQEWKIKEVRGLEGLDSKVSTLNYMGDKKSFFASYHSSNNLFQISLN